MRAVFLVPLAGQLLEEGPERFVLKGPIGGIGFVAHFVY